MKSDYNSPLSVISFFFYTFSVFLVFDSFVSNCLVDFLRCCVRLDIKLSFLFFGFERYQYEQLEALSTVCYSTTNSNYYSFFSFLLLFLLHYTNETNSIKKNRLERSSIELSKGTVGMANVVRSMSCEPLTWLEIWFCA